MALPYPRSFNRGHQSELLLADELHKLYSQTKHLLDVPDNDKGEPDGVLKGELWLKQDTNELKSYDTLTGKWNNIFNDKFRITGEMLNVHPPESPVAGQFWIYGDVLLYFNGIEWKPIKALEEPNSQFSLSIFDNFRLVTPLWTNLDRRISYIRIEDVKEMFPEEFLERYYESCLERACAASKFLDHIGGQEIKEMFTKGDIEKYYDTVVNDIRLNGSSDQNEVNGDIISVIDANSGASNSGLSNSETTNDEDNRWFKILVPNIEVDRIFLNNSIDFTYVEQNPMCIKYPEKYIKDTVPSLIHVNPGKLTKIKKRLFRFDRDNPAIKMPPENTEYYGFRNGSPDGDFLIPSHKDEFGELVRGDYEAFGDGIYLREHTAGEYDFILAITYEFAWVKSTGKLAVVDNDTQTLSYYVHGYAEPLNIFVDGNQLSERSYTTDNLAQTVTIDKRAITITRYITEEDVKALFPKEVIDKYLDIIKRPDRDMTEEDVKSLFPPEVIDRYLELVKRPEAEISPAEIMQFFPDGVVSRYWYAAMGQVLSEAITNHVIDEEVKKFFPNVTLEEHWDLAHRIADSMEPPEHIFVEDIQRMFPADVITNYLEQAVAEARAAALYHETPDTDWRSYTEFPTNADDDQIKDAFPDGVIEKFWDAAKRVASNMDAPENIIIDDIGYMFPPGTQARYLADAYIDSLFVEGVHAPEWPPSFFTHISPTRHTTKEDIKEMFPDGVSKRHLEEIEKELKKITFSDTVDKRDVRVMFPENVIVKYYENAIVDIEPIKVKPDIRIINTVKREYGFVRRIDQFGRAVIRTIRPYKQPLVFMNGEALHPATDGLVFDSNNYIYVPNGSIDMAWAVVEIYDDGPVYYVTCYASRLNEELENELMETGFIEAEPKRYKQKRVPVDREAGYIEFQPCDEEHPGGIAKTDSFILFVGGMLIKNEDIRVDWDHSVMTVPGLRRGQSCILINDRKRRLYSENALAPALPIGMMSESLVYRNGKLICNETAVKEAHTREKMSMPAKISQMHHNEIKCLLNEEASILDHLDGDYCYWDAGEERWIGLSDIEISAVKTIVGSYSNTLRSIKYNFTEREGDDIHVYGFNYANAVENYLMIRSYPYSMIDYEVYLDAYNEAVMSEDHDAMELYRQKLALVGYDYDKCLDAYEQAVFDENPDKIAAAKEKLELVADLVDGKYIPKPMVINVPETYVPAENSLSVYINGIRQYEFTEHADGLSFELPKYVSGVVTYVIERPEKGAEKTAEREILTDENIIPGTINAYRTNIPMYPGRVVIYIDGIRQPRSRFTVMDNYTLLINSETKLIGNESNYPDEAYATSGGTKYIHHNMPSRILLEVKQDYERNEACIELKEGTTTEIKIDDYSELPDDILDTADEIMIFLNGVFLGLKDYAGYTKDAATGTIQLSSPDAIDMIVSDPLSDYLRTHPEAMARYKTLHGGNEYVGPSKQLILEWR